MKKLSTQVTISFFTFSIALFLNAVPTFAQQFQWVTGGGTAASVSGTGINQWEQTKFMCADANGNIYALSYVGDDPVYADTFNETSYGANDNVLLTSYNCSGQMRWAKLLQNGGNGVTPFGIQADSVGNIYVAGSFGNDGTNMYIGYDTTISGTSTAYLTIGLIQFDTSGHFHWIRYIGPNTFVGAIAMASLADPITIDGTNNVHFFCYVQATGIPLMSGVTSTYGTYDMKYNSSGTLLSATRLQLDSSLEVYGATLDKETNKIYAYGYRNNSFTDSSNYTFIGSFDPSRNRIWIDTVSDPSEPLTEGFFSGVVDDGMGHIYLSGGSNGYLTYMGDTIAPPAGALGGYESFIMKADTTGQMKWVQQCTGTSTTAFFDMTLVPGNKIAAVGCFNELAKCGTITLDAGIGTQIQPLYMIVDTSGSLISFQQIHGNGLENEAQSVTTDNIGNIYIGGWVSDTIPDTLITSYHSVGGNTDFFILKYGVDCSCTSMPVANYTDTGAVTVGFIYNGTTTPAIDSMRWEFGDGGTSITTNPVHTYTANGTYSACVTVYTGCGSDMHCSDVTIYCATLAVASYTASGTPPTINFTYTGTTNPVIDSIRWHFGDGGTSTATNPSYTYTATGTYSVCVTVYTGCNNDTFCNTIIIPCLSPVTAAYTYTVTSPAVSFTYSGTTAGIDSVRWHFGDGSTSPLTNPSHTYSAVGTYSVCITVYTPCGSNTYCQDVVVPCVTAPSAAYSYTSAPPTVNFTYTGSTTALDSVRWYFGDGGTSTATSPAYTYTATGTYSVCVTAYSACGNNTYCSEVVTPCIIAPTASFTDTGTQTIGFTYTGTTTGVDSMRWYFGDGGTGTTTNPIYTYTAIGTYSVCVTAYSACGSDTFCSEVTIICVSTPIASFTYTGTDTANFSYTGTTTQIDSVVWNFGDGTVDTGITTTHIYADSGIYTVCVTVYTECGSDSSCNTIVVSPTGIAQLSVSNIQVFPNPTTDALNVTGVQQNTSYRLLNVTGECMSSGDLRSGSNTVFIQNIPPGVYILEMTGLDGERDIVKVVKE